MDKKNKKTRIEVLFFYIRIVFGLLILCMLVTLSILIFILLILIILGSLIVIFKILEIQCNLLALSEALFKLSSTLSSGSSVSFDSVLNCMVTYRSFFLYICSKTYVANGVLMESPLACLSDSFTVFMNTHHFDDNNLWSSLFRLHYFEANPVSNMRSLILLSHSFWICSYFTSPFTFFKYPFFAILYLLSFFSKIYLLNIHIPLYISYFILLFILLCLFVLVFASIFLVSEILERIESLF